MGKPWVLEMWFYEFSDELRNTQPAVSTHAGNAQPQFGIISLQGFATIQRIEGRKLSCRTRGKVT